MNSVNFEQGVPDDMDIEKAASEVFSLLSETDDMKERRKYGCALAKIIGGSGSFEKYITGSTGILEEKHNKLLDSFRSNVGLLVQKTWVDRKDEKRKLQAQQRLETFSGMMRAADYQNAIPVFIGVADSVASLLFGDEASEPEFMQYLFRIDPQLGIFYWFTTKLSEQKVVNPDLAFIELLIGIYSLASF